MSFDSILTLITAHGAAASSTITLLVFFIIAMWRKWIVFGVVAETVEGNLKSQLTAMTAERDEWRAVSLTSTTLAESLIAVAKLHNGVAPFGSAPTLPNGKIHES